MILHILMEFLTFQPNMLYISESLEFNGRKISSKTQKAPALHRSNIKGSRRLSETPRKNAQIKLLNAKKINHTSSFTFILFKFRSLKLYKKTHIRFTRGTKVSFYIQSLDCNGSISANICHLTYEQTYHLWTYAPWHMLQHINYYHMS